MIYYDRIDVFKGIDVNKTNESKECDICHYWYFLDKRFMFEAYASKYCHNLLMMSKNLDDTAILIINGIQYRCTISRISKSEAVNLLENAGFREKIGTL